MSTRIGSDLIRRSDRHQFALKSTPPLLFKIVSQSHDSDSQSHSRHSLASSGSSSGTDSIPTPRQPALPTPWTDAEFIPQHPDANVGERQLPAQKRPFGSCENGGDSLRQADKPPIHFGEPWMSLYDQISELHILAKQPYPGEIGCIDMVRENYYVIKESGGAFRLMLLKYAGFN